MADSAFNHKILHNPLITFPKGTKRGVLLKRKNRFCVSVKIGKRVVDVHCNNSGSMMGVIRPGVEVLVSPASNPKRRLKFTLEMILLNGSWVGVNTSIPNKLLYIAWKRGLITELNTYNQFKREVKLGSSRIDAKLNGPYGEIWIEAKNVTLLAYDVAYFPDAVTLRGQRHLEELMKIVSLGHRAACFYLIQRSDAVCFGPADFIDPGFSKLFWKALKKGVEVWPYQAVLKSSGISLGKRLPLIKTPQRW